jgi:hypothetical protein
MRGFAGDIAGEANIDRRFVTYLRTLAEQIPQKAPSQVELFRLGHAGEVFVEYAATVDAEFPEFLALRFHAIALHFDRTMRQSPVWREFKRNAAEQRMTPQQVGAIASLGAEVARALLNEDAATFADPTIAQALDALATPLVRTAELPADIVDAGRQELAVDLLESVNNVLKRLAEGGFGSRGCRRPRYGFHVGRGGCRIRARGQKGSCKSSQTTGAQRRRGAFQMASPRCDSGWQCCDGFGCRLASFHFRTSADVRLARTVGRLYPLNGKRPFNWDV